MNNLEERLVALTAYGRPRVSCMKDRTWYAVLEMGVALPGTKFEVTSDFDRASPLAAVEQLEERLRAALGSIATPLPNKALPK